nr:suface antigen 10 [Eimeria magna]
MWMFAEHIDCLAAFNKARASAGLDPFTEASQLTSTNKTKEACNALFDQKIPQDELTALSGILAVALQGKEADCNAAVTYFNGAVDNFGNLPAALETEPNANSIYANPRNLAFVALYNPQPNPQLECGFFTCTRKITDNQGTPASDEDPTGKKVATVYTYGLACSSISEPKALKKGEAPFTQEQFDKIKDAIKNSAYAAAPGLLALVAAAAGLALF